MKYSNKKKRVMYAIAFTTLLFIEIFIGMFVKDNFIRPYVGDVLVIILLCCLTRTIFPSKPSFIFQYAILIGIIIEGSQFLHLDQYLQVRGTLLGIVLGSTFDLNDLVCYIIGGTLFGLFELLIFMHQKNEKMC